MACAQTGSLLDHFSALWDPRQGAEVLCPLPETLLLQASPSATTRSAGGRAARYFLSSSSRMRR